MKPMHTITKDVSVGIYNSEYIARIYKDKIIVVSPYVKWVGNTGGYAESKQSIRDRDVVARILVEMDDGCEYAAWGLIGDAIGDRYLMLDTDNTSSAKAGHFICKKCYQ